MDSIWVHLLSWNFIYLVYIISMIYCDFFIMFSSLLAFFSERGIFIIVLSYCYKMLLHFQRIIRILNNCNICVRSFMVNWEIMFIVGLGIAKSKKFILCLWFCLKSVWLMHVSVCMAYAFYWYIPDIFRIVYLCQWNIPQHHLHIDINMRNILFTDENCSPKYSYGRILRI